MIKHYRWTQELTKEWHPWERHWRHSKHFKNGRDKDPYLWLDKIGLSLNMETKLELTDKTPFYTNPFPIKEEKKRNREMRKGCLLRITKKSVE